MKFTTSTCSPVTYIPLDYRIPRRRRHYSQIMAILVSLSRLRLSIYNDLTLSSHTAEATYYVLILSMIDRRNKLRHGQMRPQILNLKR